MSLEKDVKIRATVRNILLSFMDAGVFLFEYGDKGGFYRKPIADYRKWREDDANTFSQNLYYLKKKKLIRSFIKNKKEYLELTSLGKEKINDCLLKEPLGRAEENWDGKWRIVIFDIPEKKKIKREMIREWLKRIGATELQRSVYVHPFDFKKKLDVKVNKLMVEDEVKYIICEIIQGEEKLIDHFYKTEVLTEEDLKTYKN